MPAARSMFFKVRPRSERVGNTLYISVKTRKGANYMKKRLLSLLLVLVMLVGVLPFSVLAAEAENAVVENKAAKDAKITVSVSNKGNLALVNAAVTVKDLDKNGKLTLDEAMIATHEAYYPEGAAGYVSDYNEAYGSYSVYKLWGVENGVNYLFYLNNQMTSSVDAQIIKKGDHIVAAVLEDTTYGSDHYAYFEKDTLSGTIFDTFTLTLKTRTWEDGPAAAGVTVGTWADGVFTPIEGAVTDENGQVKLHFDEPGTYTVSAAGTVRANVVTNWTTYASEEMDCPIIAPVAVITVKKAAQAKVNVTVSNAGNLVLVNKSVTVKDLDKDGKLTVDEAMVALHKANKKGGYEVAPDGWVTKLWGVANAGYLFFVNDAGIPGLVTNSYVRAGDNVVAAVLTDGVGYSDRYTYFTDKTLAGTTIDTFELNVKAFAGMDGSAADPAGLQVGTWKKNKFTPLEDAVVNEDGVVELTFPKAGTYTVVATGTIRGEVTNWYVEPPVAEEKDCPIITPVCVIKVKKAPVAKAAKVTVTVSNAGTLALARATVTVKDTNKDGRLSFDEAMQATHKAYKKNGYKVDKNGFVTKLWGVTGGGNLFYQNDVCFDNPVPKQYISAGDDLYAAVLTDTVAWSDLYTYFTERDLTGFTGETFTLTLKGVSWGTEVIPAGLQVGTWTKKGGFTPIEGAVTDANGQVKIAFDQAGTYTVSAAGTAENIIMAPACTIKVEKVTELTITNNTNMFKAEKAYLLPDGNDQVLVMSLSGTGYKNLYKGTYDQAVANGTNTDNWIQGYENASGKWEFRIPVLAGETWIPLVAISQRNLDGYYNDQNVLARAFYPRQVVINAQAGTLVTNDYERTLPLTVTNSVYMFNVTAAVRHTLGGPNSNTYEDDLILTMGDASFDKAYVGSAEAAAAAADADTIALDSANKFTIPVKWVATAGDPESVQSIVGVPTVISFHSAGADRWYERKLTVSDTAATLTAEYNGDIASAQVDVTVSNKGVLALAKAAVTVKDLDEDGELTVDEAMVAAHTAYCPAGAAGYSAPNGWASKVWGVENNGGFLFYVNDASIPNGVAVDTVSAGDDVVAAILTDTTTWMDAYSYFTTKTLSGTIVDTYTLTLKGDLWGADMDMEGRQVGTWAEGVFTPLEGKTVNAEGKVQLTFAEPGTYIISTQADDEEPTIAPVCIIEVADMPLEFAYTGSALNFIDVTGANFGMYTPIKTSGVVLDNDQLKVTIYPNRATTYSGFYLDTLISDENPDPDNFKEAVEDPDDPTRTYGFYEFTLSTEYSGKAVAVKVVKPNGDTTSKQYYLAIPAIAQGNAVTGNKPVVSAVSMDDGTILVTAEPMENAKEYRVYASTKKGSGFKLAGTVTEPSFSFTGKIGTTYYFKVQAVFEDGSLSAKSDPAGVKQAVEQVKGLTAASSGGKVTLTWEKARGAKQYVIQVSRDGGATWKKVGTVEKLKFTFKKGAVGETLMFRVRAIPKKGAKGEFSEPVTIEVQ